MKARPFWSGLFSFPPTAYSDHLFLNPTFASFRLLYLKNESDICSLDKVDDYGKTLRVFGDDPAHRTGFCL